MYKHKKQKQGLPAAAHPARLPPRPPDLRALARHDQTIFRARILLHVSAQLLWKFCGDCRFPLQNDQQVLRRFAGTTNLRKNCAENIKILTREIP